MCFEARAGPWPVACHPGEHDQSLGSGRRAARQADEHAECVRWGEPTDVVPACHTARLGFWGYFIVARSERPLVDLGAIAPDIAEAEGMPTLDVTTEEIGEAAARWAAEAGQVADAHAIIAALAESPGPFGAGVDGLMTALGFRFGQRRDQ